MRKFKLISLVAGVVLLGAAISVVIAQPEAFRPLQAVEIHVGRLFIGAGATGFLQFDGATANSSETTVNVTDPTADRTITFPNATGTVMIAGAASGSKVVSGVTTADGSNPTAVATGLSDIAGCTVDFATGTALGDDPNSLSIDMHSAGTLDIYVWKNTSGTDPTQTASSLTTLQIVYVCVGTP